MANDSSAMVWVTFHSLRAGGRFAVLIYYHGRFQAVHSAFPAI